MMNRVRYILANIENECNIELINPNENSYLDIEAEANKLNLSKDAFLKVNLRETLIEFHIQENKDDFENIIDIYELGINAYNYLNNGLTYLVINPNGKHTILSPF